jgi:hypothetical protein
MNEVSIDISELRKRKIFVATPMYGGSVVVNILVQ